MSVPRLVYGLSTVQVELKRKRMMSPGLTHLHRNGQIFCYKTMFFFRVVHGVSVVWPWFVHGLSTERMSSNGPCNAINVGCAEALTLVVD